MYSTPLSLNFHAADFLKFFPAHPRQNFFPCYPSHMGECLLPPVPTVDKDGKPLLQVVINRIRGKRERQEIFLKAYRETGNVRMSAAAARVGEGTHHAWQQTDLEYRLVFQMVRSQLADELEGTSFNRALHGTKKPIFQNGEQVGEVTEHDFRREQFFLEAWKPGIYGKKLEVQISSRTNDEVKVKLIELLRQAGVDWDGEGEPPRMIDAEVATPSQQ